MFNPFLFGFGLGVIVVGLIIALKLRKWHFSQKNPRPSPRKLSESVHAEPQKERDLASEDSEGDGLFMGEGDELFPSEEDEDDA